MLTWNGRFKWCIERICWILIEPNGSNLRVLVAFSISSCILNVLSVFYWFLLLFSFEFWYFMSNHTQSILLLIELYFIGFYSFSSFSAQVYAQSTLFIYFIYRSRLTGKFIPFNHPMKASKAKPKVTPVNIPTRIRVSRVSAEQLSQAQPHVCCITYRLVYV